MRHPLIVIEGGDSVGKATQTKLLQDELAARGTNFSVFSFPRYDKLYGSLIRRSLQGEFGDFLLLNPYQASAFYALDRAGAKNDLERALENGVVLCDRYVPSNIAFQGAKLDGRAREEFIQFTEKAEYGELKLPKPDLVIYLEVPVEVSGDLLKGRGQQDQHEASLVYQKRVAEVYRQLAENRPDWKIVKCVRGDQLRTRNEIHEEIIALAEPFLKVV